MEGQGAWVHWLGVGVVLGLALLTKLSALALVGLAGLVIVLLAWYRRSWRLAVRLALAVGAAALAVAGWWYVRNLILYGEPTGLTAMWEVVGRRKDFGTELWSEFRGLRYSFWGLFGWFSITMPDWVYRVLDGFSILAVVGLALGGGALVLSGAVARGLERFSPPRARVGGGFPTVGLSAVGGAGDRLCRCAGALDVADLGVAGPAALSGHCFDGVLLGGGAARLVPAPRPRCGQLRS